MEDFTHKLSVTKCKVKDEGEVKAVFKKATCTAKLFVEREYPIFTSSSSLSPKSPDHHHLPLNPATAILGEILYVVLKLYNHGRNMKSK